MSYRGDFQPRPGRIEGILLVYLQLSRRGSEFLEEGDSFVGVVGGRDGGETASHLLSQFSILVPLLVEVEESGGEVGQSLVEMVGGREEREQSSEGFDQPFVMDDQRGVDLA